MASQRGRVALGAGIDANWMAPSLPQFTIPVCHQDQVIDLPEGARLLASNGHCENFMIQFNDTMLGLQGHPEFEVEYARQLMGLRKDIFGKEIYEDGIQSLDLSNDRLQVARLIVDFIQR